MAPPRRSTRNASKSENIEPPITTTTKKTRASAKQSGNKVENTTSTDAPIETAMAPPKGRATRSRAASKVGNAETHPDTKEEQEAAAKAAPAKRTQRNVKSKQAQVEETAEKPKPQAKPSRKRDAYEDDGAVQEPALGKRPGTKRQKTGLDTEVQVAATEPARVTRKPRPRAINVENTLPDPFIEPTQEPAPTAIKARGRKAAASQKEDPVSASTTRATRSNKSSVKHEDPTTEKEPAPISQKEKGKKGRKTAQVLIEQDIPAESAQNEEPEFDQEVEAIAPKTRASKRGRAAAQETIVADDMAPSARGRTRKSKQVIVEEETQEMPVPPEVTAPTPSEAEVPEPVKPRTRRGKVAKANSKAAVMDEVEDIVHVQGAVSAEFRKDSTPKAQHMEPQVVIYTPSKGQPIAEEAEQHQAAQPAVIQATEGRRSRIDRSTRGKKSDSIPAEEPATMDVDQQEEIAVSESVLINEEVEMEDVQKKTPTRKRAPPKNRVTKRTAPKKGKRAPKVKAGTVVDTFVEESEHVDAQILRECAVQAETHPLEQSFEVAVPALVRETPAKNVDKATISSPQTKNNHGTSKESIEMQEACTENEEVRVGETVGDKEEDVETHLATATKLSVSEPQVEYAAGKDANTASLASQIPVPAPIVLSPYRTHEFSKDPVKSPTPSSPLGQFSTPLSKSPVLDPAKTAAMSPVGDVPDVVAYMGTSPGSSPVKNLFQIPSTPGASRISTIDGSGPTVVDTPSPLKSVSSPLATASVLGYNAEDSVSYTPRAEIKQLDILSSPSLQPPQNLVEDEERAGKSPVKNATPRSSLDPITARNIFGAWENISWAEEASSRRTSGISPVKRQSLSFAQSLGDGATEEKVNDAESDKEGSYYLDESTEEDITEDFQNESGFFDSNSQDERNTEHTGQDLDVAQYSDEPEVQSENENAEDEKAEDEKVEDDAEVTIEPQASELSGESTDAHLAAPPAAEVSYVDEYAPIEDSSMVATMNTMKDMGKRASSIDDGVKSESLREIDLPEISILRDSGPAPSDVSQSAFDDTSAFWKAYNDIQGTLPTTRNEEKVDEETPLVTLGIAAEEQSGKNEGSESSLQNLEESNVSHEMNKNANQDSAPPAGGPQDDIIENEMLPAFMTSPEFSNLQTPPRSNRTSSMSLSITPDNAALQMSSPSLEGSSLERFNRSLFGTTWEDQSFIAPKDDNATKESYVAKNEPTEIVDQEMQVKEKSEDKGCSVDEEVGGAASNQQSPVTSSTPKSSFGTVATSFSDVASTHIAQGNEKVVAAFVPPKAPSTETKVTFGFDTKVPAFVPPKAPSTESKVMFGFDTKVPAFVPPPKESTSGSAQAQTPKIGFDTKVPAFVPPMLPGTPQSKLEPSSRTDETPINWNPAMFKVRPEDVPEFDDDFSYMESPSSHKTETPVQPSPALPPPRNVDTPVATNQLLYKVRAEDMITEFSDDFSYMEEEEMSAVDVSPLKSISADTPTRAPRKISKSPVKRLATPDTRGSPLFAAKGTPKLLPPSPLKGTPLQPPSPLRRSARLSPAKADEPKSQTGRTVEDLFSSPFEESVSNKTETSRAITAHDDSMVQRLSPKRKMSSLETSPLKRSRLYSPTKSAPNEGSPSANSPEFDEEDISLIDYTAFNLPELTRPPIQAGKGGFMPDFTSTPTSNKRDDIEKTTIKDFFSSPDSNSPNPKSADKVETNQKTKRRQSYLDSSFSATIDERRQEEAGIITPIKDANPRFADCPDSVQAKRRGRRTSSNQRRKSLDIEGQNHTFTKLQAACRGWLVRHQLRNPFIPEALPTCISATIPGHMAWAAQIITLAWKGSIVRKEFLRQKEAAITIQRAYRNRLAAIADSVPIYEENISPSSGTNTPTEYDDERFGGLLKRYDEKMKAVVSEAASSETETKPPQPIVSSTPQRQRRIQPNSPVPEEYLYKGPRGYRRSSQEPPTSKVPVSSTGTVTGTSDGASKANASRVLRALPRYTGKGLDAKRKADDEFKEPVTQRLKTAANAIPPFRNVRPGARLPRPATGAAPTATVNRLVPGNISLIPAGGLFNRKPKESLLKMTQPEVNQLTQRHTTRNRRYEIDFEREVIRLDRHRSPSPDARKSHTLAMEARVKRNQIEEEKGVTLGPGDDYDYEPEAKSPSYKGVKWHADLETGFNEESDKNSPTTAKKVAEVGVKPVIKRKAIELDGYGNITGEAANAREPPRKVKVTKYLYIGEVDELEGM